MTDLAQPSRIIVGIDLGTTNSSVAFVDTAEPMWRVLDFLVPQVVAPNTIEARETLPSFHYESAEGEFAPRALDLPWSGERQQHVVGPFARDHGGAVPRRLIASAKSWLSHAGVDRTAPLLPWHGAPDVTKLSPVEVSARYLAHVRGAWDHQYPEHPISEQEVVLTVPASFDEVARELTVEAAKRAGLVKLTLVEEPQAAFYAWINAQGERWEKQVSAGQTILVADVGGGTTDLTLIRVKPAEKGKVIFHRVAVGEHLILGGDNLDLALAHHVEQKIAPGGKLTPAQWGPLLRSARHVKETFLGTDSPERMTVNVAAGGSKLIGGARQVEVTRREVLDLLVEGFLPRVPLEARPAARRSGFQEFGLPYAADAAITKYLAAFLSAHGEGTQDVARPDVLLFNGGFFASPVLRERFLEVLASWFGRAPVLLENDRLDLAVSRGAAYYGMVRRGRGVRITGGLAHSYYIGVEAAAEQPSAMCLMPAGVEEGNDVQLEQKFNLLIRQPVEFPLYISATRTMDAPGTLVPVEAEQLTALPPIRTVLQSGKKGAAADSVAVQLHARLTEIGTLELWAQEIKGDRRWKLQFDVRSATRAEVGRHTGDAETGGVVEASVTEPAARLIRSSFSKAAQPAPASLVKRLEEATGMSRNDWPASLMRAMWDVLMEVQEARRLSLEHEIRWLNLAGFCLRPGYGLAVDDWRVAQLWRLFPQKLAFPRNEQVRAEWWVLWRRVAGGLSAGQQTTLAEPLIAAMKSRLRPAGAINQHKDSPFQYGPHESAEVWRAQGSLELLKLSQKVDLAQTILDLLPREKPAATMNAAMFALGRIGSRVPVYGPLNVIVPVETVEEWVESLISLIDKKVAAQKAEMLFPLVQMTRRTGDRYRDVREDVRASVVRLLESRGAPAHFVQLVSDGGELAAEEQKLTFGEALPRGLRIE